MSAAATLLARPRRAATGGWHRSRPVVAPVALGVLLLAGWEVAVRTMRVPPVVMPAPEQIVSAAVANLPLLLANGLRTFTLACVALAISTCVGLALAIPLSASRLLRDGVFPNLVLLELIPKIALAPLFVIWLGNGDLSRVTFAVFLSCFPIVLATMTGLAATAPSAIHLCRSLRATPAQTFAMVRFPYALPYVFSGVKIASTMAMIGVIIAEFINGDHGLGYLVMFSASNMETALMFAATALLCAFGMLLYGLVLLAERLIMARYSLS